MQTQKDHVYAYRFLIGRMTAALVAGDPNQVDPPAKRAWTGLLSGSLLAVLAVVGFGVYGLLVPGGNTEWQEPGAIIVERETGTRYVYTDGELVPTLNQASAMLFQGPNARFTTVSRASLAGVPHGAPIGINGAPDVVPRAEDLTRGPWLLCLPRPGTAIRPAMSVNLDPTVDGEPLPDDRVVPLTVDERDHVLWRDRMFPLPDKAAAVALGWANTEPLTAPAAWADRVPKGPALAPAEIDRAGEPGPSVGGRQTTIGQLFVQHSASGVEQLFVLRADGLAPLSRTEFALLAASRPDAEPAAISSAEVVAAPRSTDTSLLNRLPDLASVAPLDTVADSVCLRQQSSAKGVRSTVELVPGAANWPVTSVGGALVGPGGGMVVAALPPPAGQREPDRYLITDRGMRYRLVDDESIRSLGLAGVPPVVMPFEVLETFPAGPPLSRAALGVQEER